jgi:hypothetical protein
MAGFRLLIRLFHPNYMAQLRQQEGGASPPLRQGIWRRHTQEYELPSQTAWWLVTNALP